LETAGRDEMIVISQKQYEDLERIMPATAKLMRANGSLVISEPIQSNEARK
jgi:hypothetical protein